MTRKDSNPHGTFPALSCNDKKMGTNQQAFSQSLAGFSRKKRKRLGRLTPLASWVGWIGGNEELLARSIVA